MHSTSFAGFKWKSLDELESGTKPGRDAAEFYQKTAWDAVERTASQLYDGQGCKLDSPIGVGGRHMVRIVRFDDGTTWVARLRMTPEATSQHLELMRREIDCLNFVKQNSRVPVPIVYGHNLLDTTVIGVPTMFLECFYGNVAMDLNFEDIPLEYKESFLRDMAFLQTEISALQLPQIGTIVRQDDGSFTVGPIPNLGGPFATATAFFNAWASRTQFPRSAARIHELCGQYGEEILASIEEFPPKLRRLAHHIISCDNGPFPLCHGDFGHNNIVVDDHYKVLAVIDWEDAYTAPWETVELPLILRVMPRSTDLPAHWDADGNPTTDRDRSKIIDQKVYVDGVRDAETKFQLAHTLSDRLSNRQGLDLATSLRLYGVDGPMGWYSKVLDFLES